MDVITLYTHTYIYIYAGIKIKPGRFNNSLHISYLQMINVCVPWAGSYFEKDVTCELMVNLEKILFVSIFIPIIKVW